MNEMEIKDKDSLFCHETAQNGLKFHFRKTFPRLVFVVIGLGAFCCK